MKTPILGSSYVARSPNAADSIMVNLFPELVPESGEEPGFLNRAPGLRLLVTLPEGPIRGQWKLGNFDYVVAGNNLYKVATDWTWLLIGPISTDEFPTSGPVSMTDNGTQIFIACNGTSYIYNTSIFVLARISDPDFPGAVTVGYLDGYFVFNEPNSQKVWVTSLLDGTSIDPLDFASAEGSPDNLVALIIDHSEVWLFGTQSVEVWYNASLPQFPLQRIQGAFNEIGCEAPYSIAKMDNSIFWLGSDARGRGIVYRANGYTGVRVSTHAVEWQIQQYATINDALAYTYQQEGHSFYVLVFPTANTTWVYDASTRAWHERAGFIDGYFTRHRGNCQVSFNGEIVIGDFENGNLYAFDLDKYSDDNRIQRWLRRWRALPTDQNNLKRTAHHSLQLDCQSGVGSSTDLDEFYLITQSGDRIVQENGFPIIADSQNNASDPQVILRWSDDGGHTWSNEHWASMGKIGEYSQRVIWRRLGMTQKLRDRVYEISGTDPVKIVIMGAELILSGTNA